MAEIWFTSDTHFNHANILKFTGSDGKRIRPEFDTSGDMDWHMVKCWNKVVAPSDKVYHLGDVAFGVTRDGTYIERLMGSLLGHKRLVVGNHDHLEQPFFNRHFEKISLWRIFKEHGFFCCHIPQRQDVFRFTPFQVHGHIHQNLMKESCYMNICVEHTDYTPVHLDTIKGWIRDRS